MATVTDDPSERGEAVEPRGPLSRLVRRPSGAVALLMLALIAGACVLSLPWTLGTGSDGSARYASGSLDAFLLPPSWAGHGGEESERAANTSLSSVEGALGTDKLGRSVLVRVLCGGAVSLGVGIASAAVSVFIGVLWGAIAASVGGRTDAVMMRIVDVLYGLPYILLVVLLAVAGEAVIDRVGGGAAMGGWRTPFELLVLLTAIGGVSWLTMSRVIRGQVLSLRSRPFMDAARAAGVGPVGQFTRHLLPNLVGPIVVYATLTVPQAILQESFLSFLGIGVKPPLPSWGNLAAEGLGELNPVRVRWWLLVFPCGMLAVTLVCLNVLGEAVREVFDPRSRRR